eukprot:TRINITY_DN6095_c0_g1_i1.p2 TRINITY_DN6095_c0_g1~~TRINITY_DN6095_c0_g1_i1.p2  ORF type:complete len:375 (+),score=59.73 TRINITY_DN6095_c0_g1_i1:110-1234(+)
MAQAQSAVKRAQTPVSRTRQQVNGTGKVSENGHVNGSEDKTKEKEWREFINMWPAEFSRAMRCSILTFLIYAVCTYAAVVRPCLPVAFVWGGAIVRTFVLFHDACHGALFPGGAGAFWNGVIGRLCEPFVGRSMEVWSASHNKHHRILGSEPPPKVFPPQDGPDHDDSRTVLFSLQQYQSYPLWKKIMARAMRDPFVFFGIVVPVNWVVIVTELRARLLGFAWNAVVAWYFGADTWKCFFVAQWLALVMAGLLFQLQHQVNPGYWKDHHHGYEWAEAVQEGCSYLVVPFWAQWITLGIEFHHIHHFSIKVPCYRLKECHEAWKDSDFVSSVTVVPMLKAFKSCFHAMWDEATEEYCSFDIYRALGLEDRVKDTQ